MKEVKYKKWHSWNHKWFADCWDASCTSRATRLFFKTFCDTFGLPLPSTVAFEALEKSFDYINAVKTTGDCKNLTVHCISRRKWQSKVTFFVFFLLPITLVVMNICWKKDYIPIFYHFSTLIWHRQLKSVMGEGNPPPPPFIIQSPYRVVGDNMVMQETRTSTDMVFKKFSRNIKSYITKHVKLHFH